MYMKISGRNCKGIFNNAMRYRWCVRPILRDTRNVKKLEAVKGRGGDEAEISCKNGKRKYMQTRMQTRKQSLGLREKYRSKILESNGMPRMYVKYRWNVRAGSEGGGRAEIPFKISTSVHSVRVFSPSFNRILTCWTKLRSVGVTRNRFSNDFFVRANGKTHRFISTNVSNITTHRVFLLISRY